MRISTKRKFHFLLTHYRDCLIPNIDCDPLPKGKTMQSTERRNFQRYKVAYGAYAVAGPEVAKLGQIKNISMGGLAFNYLADESRSQHCHEMDIIIRQDSMRIKNLPVKTISDFELAQENVFSTVKLRQLGVQFGELTPDQTTQLEHLLKTHTSWTDEHS